MYYIFKYIIDNSYLHLLLCQAFLSCSTTPKLAYNVSNCPDWVVETIETAESRIEHRMEQDILIKLEDAGIPVTCKNFQEFYDDSNCKDLGDHTIACAKNREFITINTDRLKYHNGRISIIIHEFLHVFGVQEHSEDEKDVMFGLFVPEYPDRELTENDIARLKEAIKAYYDSLKFVIKEEKYGN